MNLSVTGVLVRTDHPYCVGECVEVEIDFLGKANGATVVAGVGVIVREHNRLKGAVAVRFQIECGLASRSDAAVQPDFSSDPSARQTRAASGLE